MLVIFRQLKAFSVAALLLTSVCLQPHNRDSTAFLTGAAHAQEKFPDFLNGPLTFGGAVEDDDADIQISALLKPLDETTVDLQVTVKLPDGYYIYSMNQAFSGHAEIKLTHAAGLKSVTEWKSDHDPKVVDDKDLGQTVEKFFGAVTWSQRLKSESGRLPDGVSVAGELTGMFCSSGSEDMPGICKPIRPAKLFTARLVSAGATQASFSDGAASAVDDSADGAAAVKQVAETAATPNRSPVVIVPQIGYGSKKKPAPIKFSISLTPANPKAGDEVTLNVRADVDRPWHTFAIDQDPTMAGEPTAISLVQLVGAEATKPAFVASAEPELEHPTSDIIQRVHYDSVVWSQSLKCTASDISISGTILFQLCNEGTCIPPTEIEFTVTPGDDPGIGTAVVQTGESTKEKDSKAEPGSLNDLSPEEAAAKKLTDDGLMAFIVTAFGAGLIALLTPCVFPMIPVTVAFFLKQSEKNQKSPVGLAIVYCLGIIGTFTILGLLVAVIFGPTKLNELANNRWLNLFFAGLFMIFALMLMGMFELRLPSWLLTWSSKRESTGGVIGALFMALTFTLVSFTCTFAFVGTLLVVAAKGDFFWPIVGMLAFSSAFASPFFLLALFPSMLKKLPKSGGWMNTVKVTMGLVELALVLKFLSVADIGFSPDRLPMLLDSTSFLVGWVVIAAVTGAYLLNVFRMSHDSPVEGISAVRCLFGILFLTLSAYISVGVFSATPPAGLLWQQIAAFAPPSKPHHLLDFRVAVDQAQEENRLLFLDFTGVNCVNCRKMENTVLADPSIRQALEKMVQVQLFTDEIPGIKNRVLRDELLELNRTLQSEWFGDVTLPGYAVVTPDGKNVITMFKGLDGTGGEDFLKFINAGVDRWEKFQSSQSVANRQAGSDTTSPNRL